MSSFRSPMGDRGCQLLHSAAPMNLERPLITRPGEVRAKLQVQRHLGGASECRRSCGRTSSTSVLMRLLLSLCLSLSATVLLYSNSSSRLASSASASRYSNADAHRRMYVRFVRSFIAGCSGCCKGSARRATVFVTAAQTVSWLSGRCSMSEACAGVRSEVHDFWSSRYGWSDVSGFWYGWSSSRVSAPNIGGRRQRPRTSLLVGGFNGIRNRAFQDPVEPISYETNVTYDVR